MKKLLSLLLALMLCLSLCACDALLGEETKPHVVVNHVNAGRTITQFGFPLVTNEELAGKIVVNELTVDNWKEYFQVEKLTDELGEDYGWCLAPKNWKNAISGFCGQTATVELKDLKTEEVTTYELTAETPYVVKLDKAYTIDDFACVSIQATVLVAPLPENLWVRASVRDRIFPDNKGQLYVAVGTEEDHQMLSQFFNDCDLQVYLDRYGK